MRREWIGCKEVELPLTVVQEDTPPMTGAGLAYHRLKGSHMQNYISGTQSSYIEDH